MSDRYILVGHEPKRCDDLLEWGRWFEKAERHVAEDYLPGDVHVSTVFLGLDHRWGEGPPLLFETMIFGGPNNEYQERYSTWAEAEIGHAKAVTLAKEAK
jgi:hypothetical protein